MFGKEEYDRSNTHTHTDTHKKGSWGDCSFLFFPVDPLLSICKDGDTHLFIL